MNSEILLADTGAHDDLLRLCQFSHHAVIKGAAEIPSIEVRTDGPDRFDLIYRGDDARWSGGAVKVEGEKVSLDLPSTVAEHSGEFQALIAETLNFFRVEWRKQYGFSSDQSIEPQDLPPGAF